MSRFWDIALSVAFYVNFGIAVVHGLAEDYDRGAFYAAMALLAHAVR